ncbi:MAG TPA: phosphoribosyltransferase family protein [Chitinophagaceae bacterium]|jgi:pyrimidine operon attenuation protein/uracil phosphoribosyltransferase
MDNKRNILSKEVADQKLQRLALEVAEQLSGDNAPIILIGIRKSGTVIAEKIGALLKPYVRVPVQIISVSFDKQVPKEITLTEEPDFTDKNILLIDDVTNSGKTLMYAIKPLLNFYPRRIQTLVLIERMHKLFPIKPDYVGLSVATTMQDHIHVQVSNNEVIGAFVE